MVLHVDGALLFSIRTRAATADLSGVHEQPLAIDKLLQQRESEQRMNEQGLRCRRPCSEERSFRA